MSRPLTLLLDPVSDVFGGLERCLARGPRQMLLVMVGLALGWWVYVPVHELLHALACSLAGGTVSRLEISAAYGGELLARVFPFVDATGARAGRLSGFDTGGSDLVYLVTVFGPYVLTVFPGVWLLRLGGSTGRSLLFGAALPLAWAPFIALAGDAYEIGSIVTTRLPPWASMQELLRGDDLLAVVSRIRETPGALPWTGVVCGTALGVAWAVATYLAGSVVAGVLGRRSGEGGR